MKYIWLSILHLSNIHLLDGLPNRVPIHHNLLPLPSEYLLEKMFLDSLSYLINVLRCFKEKLDRQGIYLAVIFHGVTNKSIFFKAFQLNMPKRHKTQQ